MSNVAMIRDVPWALWLPRVDGSFFTEARRQECRERIESLTLQSPRQWSTVTVDQMLRHLNLACSGVQRSAPCG
jgi:hypothetical protein